MEKGQIPVSRTHSCCAVTSLLDRTSPGSLYPGKIRNGKENSQKIQETEMLYSWGRENCIS